MLGVGMSYPGWLTLPRAHKNRAGVAGRGLHHCFGRCRIEALVEYDYEAQHTDELSIRVGDTVTDLAPTEPGWMRGKLRGKVGVFPDNFVKMVHRDAAKPKPKLSEPISSLKTNGVPKRPGRRRCRALFSYAPEKADELELKLHDVIDVLEEVEPGWWKGSLSGKVGVFPSNFVEELPPAEPEPVQEIKPKPVKGVGLGDILKDAKARPPPHLAKPPDPASDTPAPQLPPKPVKELCKALFAYTRQNEDELTLKEGDIVTIVSKESEDKGWWRGELNGKVGVFPDNFVEIISSTDKPARPEKPPGKPLSARPSESEKPESAAKSASADSAPRPALPQPPSAGLRLQDGATDEPTSSLPKPAPPAAAKPLPVSSKASSPPPVGVRADGIASMLATAAAAAAAAVNSRHSNTSPPALPKSPPPKLPSPKATSPKPSLPPAKPASVPPKPAAAPTNTSTPDTNMSHPPVLADDPASQTDAARKAGKPDGDTSLEEFDAVERGPDRLTHITADRARGPGRRPPSAVFTRESMSPRSPVSPASPSTPAVTEEPELTNGTADSAAAAAPAPALAASPSAPPPAANAAPPWMRELQRAQNKRISRLAETDDDKLELTSSEDAGATTASSAHAQTAAPPWMRELQRTHSKKHPAAPSPAPAPASRDEENASGDSRQPSEETDSAASSAASAAASSSSAAAAAVSAKPVRPESTAEAAKPRRPVLRGSTAKPVETPPPRPVLPSVAATAAVAAVSRPGEVKDLRDEVAQLQTQLAEQGRQFTEALTALRADYQKRMRTVLDELDAEKKARLVMQVQLDRLDKLVKDMNFTV